MTNIKVLAHRHRYTETLHDACVYLLQNKTSWVLYNMAAFYWRIKGEPFQAIECVRRALHHSPRYASSAPLLSSVFKGELKQRSIIGCMDRNRIKTRHSSFFAQFLIVFVKSQHLKVVQAWLCSSASLNISTNYHAKIVCVCVFVFVWCMWYVVCVYRHVIQAYLYMFVCACICVHKQVCPCLYDWASISWLIQCYW